jgi:hypothetical protein
MIGTPTPDGQLCKGCTKSRISWIWGLEIGRRLEDDRERQREESNSIAVLVQGTLMAKLENEPFTSKIKKLTQEISQILALHLWYIFSDRL